MKHPPISLLVVSTSLNTGGAQRFTSTLLRHLDRDKIKPSLCVLRDDIAYALPGDVPVHRLGYSGLHSFPMAARRLRKLIERNQPQVVLSTVTANNLLTAWALRTCRYRPPWIARIGTNPEFHEKGVRRQLSRWLYPAVDTFVVNSPGLADTMERCFPGSASRTECILNPTDFEQIDRLASLAPIRRHDGSRPLLLAVGRLFEAKRYDIMLEALALLKDRRDFELWICGDGPLRRSLERMTRKLGLENHVSWLGFCDNPYSLMQQADLFLLTSDHEGLPNALIEAQGLGIPAVATRCPFGPEQIIDHEVTGVLVPLGLPEPITEAIDSRLSGSILKQMGDAARRSSRQRFAPGPLVSSWEALVYRSTQSEDPA